MFDQFIRQQARLHRQVVGARRIVFRGRLAALVDELLDLRPHRLFFFGKLAIDAVEVCLCALQKLIGRNLAVRRIGGRGAGRNLSSCWRRGLLRGSLWAVLCDLVRLITAWARLLGRCVPAIFGLGFFLCRSLAARRALPRAVAPLAVVPPLAWRQALAWAWVAELPLPAAAAASPAQASYACSRRKLPAPAKGQGSADCRRSGFMLC